MKNLFNRIVAFLTNLFTNKNNMRKFKKTKTKKTKKQDVYVITNKEKRDAFLKSKGYTVGRKIKSNKDKPIFTSHYRACVLAFSKLKNENKIKIYDNGIGGVIRNKYGIPFYKLLK